MMCIFTMNLAHIHMEIKCNIYRNLECSRHSFNFAHWNTIDNCHYANFSGTVTKTSAAVIGSYILTNTQNPSQSWSQNILYFDLASTTVMLYGSKLGALLGKLFKSSKNHGNVQGNSRMCVVCISRSTAGSFKIRAWAVNY